MSSSSNIERIQNTFINLLSLHYDIRLMKCIFSNIGPTQYTFINFSLH